MITRRGLLIGAIATPAIIKITQIMPVSNRYRLIQAQDWLPCDGRTVSIDAYRELFRVIGDKYGPAPANGYFTLPDFGPYGNHLISTRKLLWEGQETLPTGMLRWVARPIAQIE